MQNNNQSFESIITNDDDYNQIYKGILLTKT